MIIERRLRASIEAKLRITPAVVLLGPRQVGKTTLAREIAEKRNAGAVYLDLERPADRRRLDDADAYLRAQAGKLACPPRLWAGCGRCLPTGKAPS